MLLAGHGHHPLVALEGLRPRDVLVRDHQPAAVVRVEESGPDQPVAQEHRVLAGRRGRPHEARAGGRVPECAQRRQRAPQGVAVAGRQHGVGHRVVDGRAVPVQLSEAAAVARERPALPDARRHASSGSTSR